MKNETTFVLILIMCSVTCIAAWKAYTIAESLRPLVNAIELIKSVPFLN